jgi:hypothetical protein
MRRLFIALAVVAALAGSAFAQEQPAAKHVTKQELQAVTEAAPLMPLTLTTLFKVAGDQFIADGIWIPVETTNIVVARKNDDGTLSTACVATEKAAKSFLERKQRDEPGRPAEQ